MFYDFSGLSISSYSIISPYSGQKVLFTKNFGPFCIFAPIYAEGNDAFMQKTPSSAYYITNTDFYEERTSGASQVKKQISFSVMDSSSKLIEEHRFPYSLYPDYPPSHEEINYVSLDIPNDGQLNWNLYYKDKSDQVQHGLSISKKFSDIITPSDSFSIQLTKDNTNNDKTYFTFKIEKCEMFERSKVFNRKWNYIAFQPRDSYVGYYSSIYFSNGGTLFQNTCDYYTSCMVNSDFKEDSIHYETDENYNIHLRSLSSNKDDFSCNINIYLNYIHDNQIKQAFLGTYSTTELSKNTGHTAEEMGLQDITFNCYVPFYKHSNITINGNIKYKKSGTATIKDQVILYHDFNQTNIVLDDKTYSTFGFTKIVPTIAAGLYKRFGKPEQEILAETVKVTLNESNTLTIHFKENEMYKIIDITSPDFIGAKNIYLFVYTKSGKNLYFIRDQDRKSFNENCFYFYTSTLTYLSIPNKKE